MAFGQLQGGGLLEPPSVPELGYEDWAEMSSMDPGHALVGGGQGLPGLGTLGQRSVALGASQPLNTVNAPARSHWSELMNLGGNPIGWVLIVMLFYLGLTHLHVRAGASVGYRGR